MKSLVLTGVPPFPGSPSLGCSLLGWSSLEGWPDVLVRLGFGDRDPRGPQQPLTQPVAGREDLDAGGLGHLRGQMVRQRLVHPRVERLARLAETDQTELAERGLQRP